MAEIIFIDYSYILIIINIFLPNLNSSCTAKHRDLKFDTHISDVQETHVR